MLRVGNAVSAAHVAEIKLPARSTGPMYLKYNAVLRGLNDNDGGKLYGEYGKLCCNNKYTTTLHLINSAVIKLGKLTAVGKVFR